MILILKKLDFITKIDTVYKTNEATFDDESQIIGCSDIINGVILDTRPFDVTRYPNLKVISRVGVGVDNIDLDECEKRNIKVYTTPCYELHQAVAEFTIKQLLNLMSINGLRDTLDNSKVFIIGGGNIGSFLGRLLSYMGCLVYYYDKDVASSTFYSEKSFHTQLPEADIVSVHVSGTDCVLGKNEMDLLKDNCYVLNMARRGCVDTDYLYKQIMEGRKIKYASDVDSRNDITTGVYVYERLKNNVIITPHVASKTVAARKAMEKMALDNLVRGLNE